MLSNVYTFCEAHPLYVGFVSGSLFMWGLKWIQVSINLPESRVDEQDLLAIRDGVWSLGREVGELRRRLLGVCLAETDQSSAELKESIQELKTLIIGLKGEDKC